LPTVLIADDYATARSAIRARFENYSGFIVCGEAVDGADAIEKALKLHPDLILLDLAMPTLNGVEAASVLKGLQPHEDNCVHYVRRSFRQVSSCCRWH
jgi:DNA-binding NarL/FixJ family response regulator